MIDFDAITTFFSHYGVIIFAVLIILLALRIFRKKTASKQGTTIFLLGECGSGKTALLYYLSNKSQFQTVSSLKENLTTLEIEAENKNYQIPISDLPGHHHFREVFFKRIADCKGIILMVDAANQKANANVAEMIYNILTNKNYIEREMPILIVLNKMDLMAAKKQNEVEEDLIKEMERIKLSRRGVADDSEEFDDYLKAEEKKFSFGEYDIKFCEASVTNENVKEVINFLIDIY